MSLSFQQLQMHRGVGGRSTAAACRTPRVDGSSAAAAAAAVAQTLARQNDQPEGDEASPQKPVSKEYFSKKKDVGQNCIKPSSLILYWYLLVLVASLLLIRQQYSCLFLVLFILPEVDKGESVVFYSPTQTFHCKAEENKD